MVSIEYLNLFESAVKAADAHPSTFDEEHATFRKILEVIEEIRVAPDRAEVGDRDAPVCQLFPLLWSLRFRREELHDLCRRITDPNPAKSEKLTRRQRIALISDLIITMIKKERGNSKR